MATKSNAAAAGPQQPKPAPQAVPVSRAEEPPTGPEFGDEVLSEAQKRALEKIVAGRSIKSVARDVGVHRNTIYHWLSQDIEFIAAYNAWRLEIEESARARIAGLTDAAVNVVRRALARDNSAVALAVLKGQNLLAPSSIGSSDPQELRRRADIAKVDRDTALWEAKAQIGHRRDVIRDDDIDTYGSAFRRLKAARDAAAQPESEEPKK